MFIKKYCIFLLIPLFLSGESIIGKWEIDSQKTEQSISKLTIDSNDKQFLILLASKGYKSIECFNNKTCILKVNETDSCLGKFNWKKEHQRYILTPYKNKLCNQKPSMFKNTTITVNGDQLTLSIDDNLEGFSYIYKKTQSYHPQKEPKMFLENIKYNKLYKSRAVDTYFVGASSLLPTYFYLVFTDKDMFYSVGTTQNNISTVKEIKDIFRKHEEESKLSAKESLERLKNMPDNLAGIKNKIYTTGLIHGRLTPNKNGISGLFNFYHKESDIHVIRGGFKSDASRKCTQITFKSRNKLSCNNGVEYTLLDTVSAHQSKKPTAHANENIVNIDIQAEKEAEKRKAVQEYRKAVQEVM